MFDKILPSEAKEIVSVIGNKIDHIYLAGGTGLSLQLGHRVSADLDFFSKTEFNVDSLINDIQPDKVYFSEKDTLHCELNGIKITFLYYKQPIIYRCIKWNNINIADWKDIAAEKLKTISQRGSKKDFYDIYAVLKLKLTIEELCQIFKKGFCSSDINYYHIIRSIVFFEDAENEPIPTLLIKEDKWDWENVKMFFENNIKDFEKYLLIE